MNTSVSSFKKPFYIESGFLIKAGIYAILLGGLYYSTLQRLFFHDWVKDDYSHCILIPLIVVYLIWEKHRLISEYDSKPSYKGLYLLGTGLCLFWLGELAGEYFTLYFSLWVIILSVCYLNMGWGKLKIILFPIIFSLTMFPFPALINNKITIALKLISSKIGVMMMQVYGMSAFREGNIIDLGFTKLQVVDACSGLRYLFPMIVLSLLMAYFYKARWWKKLVLVLSSVPLTIFTNSLRIALTGILSEKFGSKVVEGFFHDFEGWLIFMITLAVLLGEMWLMNKLFKERAVIIADDADIDAVHDLKENIDQKPALLRPQFLVSVVLLSLTLVLTRGIEFREAIPMSQSFKEFPMKVGKWTGSNQDMEIKFIDALDFSDYIMADYHNDSGRVINFYVAYYESQRKGESIHSPATCLRGGGWQFKKAGSQQIKLQDGNSIPVNRALIEKGSAKQLSYYWFPSRDRILTNAYQMKIYNFWDALTRKRTDGALVRIITLVYPDESVEDAEKRMQAFISDINPVLKKFLPGTGTRNLTPTTI